MEFMDFLYIFGPLDTAFMYLMYYLLAGLVVVSLVVIISLIDIYRITYIDKKNTIEYNFNARFDDIQFMPVVFLWWIVVGVVSWELVALCWEYFINQLKRFTQFVVSKIPKFKHKRKSFSDYLIQFLVYLRHRKHPQEFI